MKTRKLDTTAWLESYVEQTTGQSIDMHSDGFQQVKDFPLIWNVFEARFFDKECSVDKVWKASHLAPHEPTTNEAFHFFKERYLDGKEPSFRFDSLNLVDRYKEPLLAILCSVTPSIDDKNRVCRMIISRYRNNLFHGEKELYSLKDQIELFTVANAYLIDLIDTVLGKR